MKAHETGGTVGADATLTRELILSRLREAKPSLRARTVTFFRAESRQALEEPYAGASWRLRKDGAAVERYMAAWLSANHADTY